MQKKDIRIDVKTIIEFQQEPMQIPDPLWKINAPVPAVVLIEILCTDAFPITSNVPIGLVVSMHTLPEKNERFIYCKCIQVQYDCVKYIDANIIGKS